MDNCDLWQSLTDLILHQAVRWTKQVIVRCGHKGQLSENYKSSPITMCLKLMFFINFWQHTFVIETKWNSLCMITYLKTWYDSSLNKGSVNQCKMRRTSLYSTELNNIQYSFQMADKGRNTLGYLIHTTY